MASKKQEKTASLIAQASNLSDLITYQEGSVISRTIIDKTSGTVTLFAFDQDQGLSEHTAPYDALVYAIVGQANFTIAGNRVIIKQGDMTIMPANKPHSLVALSKFKMLLIMIKS